MSRRRERQRGVADGKLTGETGTLTQDESGLAAAALLVIAAHADQDGGWKGADSS
jgi:hypothetical protein